MITAITTGTSRTMLEFQPEVWATPPQTPRIQRSLFALLMFKTPTSSGPASGYALDAILHDRRQGLPQQRDEQRVAPDRYSLPPHGPREALDSSPRIRRRRPTHRRVLPAAPRSQVRGTGPARG